MLKCHTLCPNFTELPVYKLTQRNVFFSEVTKVDLAPFGIKLFICKLEWDIPVHVCSCILWRYGVYICIVVTGFTSLSCLAKMVLRASFTFNIVEAQFFKWLNFDVCVVKCSDGSINSQEYDLCC